MRVPWEMSLKISMKSKSISNNEGHRKGKVKYLLHRRRDTGSEGGLEELILPSIEHDDQRKPAVLF